MPRFNDVDVFLAVIEEGSFRRAASVLGLTKSTVSRAIKRLEEHLEVSLLVRDQQALRVTDAGAEYHRHALQASALLADGERKVAAVAGAVRGTVRVSAPPALGQACLARMCASFVAQHPHVDIQLVLTDEVVSLTQTHFDLVVRTGNLGNSELRARRLVASPISAVATPSLAAQLPELSRIPEVRFIFPDSTKRRVPDPPAPLETRLMVNDYLALREAVLAGCGVGLLSEFLVARELQRGDLVRVLEAWSLPTASFWALYPNSDAVPLKVRALLDHLIQEFAVYGGSRLHPRGA